MTERETQQRGALAWLRGAIDLVLSGPTIGAAYLVALTVIAFRLGDDDRVLGVSAAPIVELAKNRFSGDIDGLTWALAASAIGYGALIGCVAEAIVGLRRLVHGDLSSFAARLVARVGWVVVLQALLFLRAVATNPQLYVETLYARHDALGPIARTLQVVTTDVLHANGCLLVAFVAALVFIAPTGPVLRRFARWGRRVVERSPVLAGGITAAVVFLPPLASWAVGASIGHAAQRHKHPGRPNILILAADSLRDDRLTQRVAPELSKIAADGTRLSSAYVTLPRTLPSWTTILTGREPHNHGLRTMFPRYDDRARPLHALPERLSALGYQSAVVGDYAADIFTRVRYGFDIVDAPTFNFHALIATRALERAIPLLPALQSQLGRRVLPAMREMNQAADPMLVEGDVVRALDRLEDRDAPFMLTVFFSTAHFPYAAPEPYYRKFTDPAYRGRFRYHKPNVLGQEAPLDGDDLREVRSLYDGAVASIDNAAGEIFAELRRRGLDDDTTIVITADHGEMLYEDGHGQGHGDHLFGDEVVHVPLVIRPAPSLGAIAVSAKGRSVDELVRDVDLAPTLLSLSGADEHALEGMDGRSIVPLLKGESLPARPVFGETEIWMTESIAEVPATGPNAMRLPYPNVSQLTELDPRLGYDVVLRAEVEPLIVAAKHRMLLERSAGGEWKLIYAPTRKGARYFLFDRKSDPREVRDVSGDHVDIVARMKATLFRWMLGDRGLQERDGMVVPRDEAALDSIVGARDASVVRLQ